MPEFWVNSGYGLHTRQPFVSMHDGDWVRQVSPEEARQIARNLMEAAEAAEVDDFLITWAQQSMDVPLDSAVNLLAMYREHRDARRLAALRRREGQDSLDG